MQQPFTDRHQAGVALAKELNRLRHKCKWPAPLMVLALPRGGVPVAAPVADALSAPLDVMMVRKLGCPGNPELAMGAVASGGVHFLNHHLIRQLSISQYEIERALLQEQRELARREAKYRHQRPPLALAGKTVILVDDGLATGATMRVAIEATLAHQPDRVLVAVPVGSADTIAELAPLVDRVCCLATPLPFFAVGQWYLDFPQVDDDEVIALMAEH
ncbi:phosphoribosyltransferase [Oceanimonas sp. CHS3-5]|uniref:phosphoribosyltransferase n=1 Tax=Oceanimonas sp. CHS3-5 TaxID=3068186 RepID=UPI00273DF5F5|nr:phosphoribosyltransferase [Oceanimonas sp. CHS3-5]MDP5291339.1 phosphoribosyltransferase [Oceanimonas sp. CHS3-5]